MKRVYVIMKVRVPNRLGKFPKRDPIDVVYDMEKAENICDELTKKETDDRVDYYWQEVISSED